MKRRMKQKKYGILMVVGIVMMVLMPFAPCRADWVHISSDGYNTTPTSDSDSGGGSGCQWSWEYAIPGTINRGGDDTGSWAYANIEAEEKADVSASGAADPDNPQPEVWGRSYYADIANPNYTSDGLDLRWELSANGTVEVYGYVIDGGLGAGDTVYSEADAGGAGSAWNIYGVGMARGNVEEDSYGWAWADVQGEATEDDDPIIVDGEYGWYYAYLEFTVSADDSQDDVAANPGADSFTGTSALWVIADAYASASISEGYSGKALAEATVDFGGTADLYVDMPE